MNIVKDYRISEKYHPGFLRLPIYAKIKSTFPLPETMKNLVSVKPHTLILHGTAGGHKNIDCLNWMHTTGRPRYPKGIGIFHYLIDRETDLINELVNPDFWYHHASCGWFDKHTIGVELINPNRQNGGRYTDIQYKNLVDLFDYLQQYYPLTTIMSHKRAKQKYSNGTKECPGNGFDWIKFETMLMDKGYDFNHKIGYESYWGLQKT